MSKQFPDVGKTYLTGGTNTYSKARHPSNAPEFASWAQGCMVTGSDAQIYVDYTSALGAVILGHCDYEVSAAAKRQIQLGNSFSLPTEMEHTLAERLCRLTGFEQARFGKNGNDVTNAAIRIARAHTGRDYIAVYDNSYHGHASSFMTRAPKNGGIPSAVKALTKFFKRHDLQSLEFLLERENIACVVIEAVVSGDPVLPPVGYFDALKELCARYGTLLVLDEMVTGFRMGFPGALSHYGIKPDLACYGKAIANGFPFSALLGSAELMNHIETDVFYSTTFGGECVSIAAALATLDVMERESVAEVMGERGRKLMVAYDELARKHGVDSRLYGYPQRPMLYFNDSVKRTRFLEGMVSRGYLTQGYFNLMLAHDDIVIERTIKVFDECLGEIADELPEAA